MTNFFIRLYRFFRSHRAIHWGTMIVLFAFFGYFAAQLHLEEDLNKLMPESQNADGSTKLAFADLRIKDKTFLLFEAVDGASPERITKVCDEFVDSLLARDAMADSLHKSIGDIFYNIPEDLLPLGIDYLREHLPAYIPPSVYPRIDSLLTLEQMQAQMAQNREQLTGELGEAFPELILMDPIGMRNVLADEMKPLVESGGGGYKTLEEHFFVPDSSVCVAFLTPHFSATNTGQGSALFRTMNDLIEIFKTSAPDIRISYHGTPASGFYNSSQIKHDLVSTVGGSLLVVLLFLFLSFRRRGTLVLLVLPVLFGTLVGLAMMQFIKGQFSLLALGIGAVVLGVALSYVLHILTHQRYAENTEQMLREQVTPVSLGCITTVGSFMGLIFINTPLLKDFGLFAAFAIVGTTLFCLALLPPLLGERKEGEGQPFAWAEKISNHRFHECRPLLWAIGIAAAVCIGAFLVKGTEFDANMHNLGFNAPLTTYSENLLRSKTHTQDKQKYFAAQGATAEEATENFARLSAKLDSLQREGLVKSYTPTNLLLVSKREQERRIRAWHAFWTDERLQRVKSLIAATAPEAGMRAEAFQPFFDAATADYEPDALYEADILPEGFLSTLMEQSYGGDWLCFTNVRCKNDSVRSRESDYMRICDAVTAEDGLMVLDTYYYTTDTLQTMNREFNILQWVSMLFVAAVLLVSFRFRLRLTLLGFMPILVSWLIVLGAMALAGRSFNLINIIISTFVFGIGVDYSIFVMNGLTGGEGNARLLSQHKTAILFSAVTLTLTVGSMLLARHPAIQSVGFSTLVGLLSAVVLSWVAEPAIFNLLNKKDSR